MSEKVIIHGREYDPEWLDLNFLSDRWIKAKYKCIKETKGCARISVWTKKAGRCKCIPCEFLEVTHPDGSVTTLFKGTVNSQQIRINPDPGKPADELEIAKSGNTRGMKE